VADESKGIATKKKKKKLQMQTLNARRRGCVIPGQGFSEYQGGFWFPFPPRWVAKSIASWGSFDGFSTMLVFLPPVLLNSFSPSSLTVKLERLSHVSLYSRSNT
jgi:hypothetical protein